MAGLLREVMSRIAAILLASFLVVACSPSIGTPTQPAICDGIPADMGGCSSSRPTFVGSTCQELAEEWGRHVDQQVIAVMNGPEEADGKKRSVRISDVLALSSIVVGMRLDELNLLSSCDLPEFLPAAKGQFLAALKAGIGSVLFDGDPIATDRDWDAALARAVGIIDDGE